jgi:L-rhamnose isomerase
MARNLLSMIVDQVNVKRVAGLEAKNDPPVRTHDDGPKAFKIANESVKAESRNVHVFDCCRRIQEAENVVNPLDVLCPHTLAIIVLEETLEALVAKADNHRFPPSENM